MSVRVLYSLKLKVAPHPYQKLVPLNALLPVALRYPSQYLYFYYNLLRESTLKHQKAPDRSQELSNTGGELFNRNSSSLETKFQG